MSIYPKRAALLLPGEIERAQIVLKRSQPGLPRFCVVSFWEDPEYRPESSGVVLTGVGTTKVTKERQAPSTDIVSDKSG